VNTETADTVKAETEKLSGDDIKYLLVGNKTDLVGTSQSTDEHKIFISAKNKDNIRELKQKLYDMTVQGEVKQEGTIITNARHYGALQEVMKSLQDIKAGMDNNLSGDLVALDIRRCLHFLGDITGEVTTEDKLDYIFSKFCIGK
jgi:tRNA modification GTPase